MWRGLRAVAVGVLLGLAILFAPGCGRSANTATQDASPAKQETDGGHDGRGHDHDQAGSEAEHPESFADAVAEIETLRSAIRDAFVAGNPHEADSQLHEIGHILKELPGLASDSDMPKPDWNEVVAASNTLFDRFSKIDEKVHGGEGLTYSDAEADIDQAIEALKTKVPAGTAP